VRDRKKRHYHCASEFKSEDVQHLEDSDLNTRNETFGLLFISYNNSIQLIYLRAWQQPDKANYSQSVKQQYKIKIVY
jgi:hypothetical protein